MNYFEGPEKGVPIRQPSTANLLIASQNRYGAPNPNTTAGSFTIQKNQSILNGFFTRLAPTEVFLQWTIPNVYDVSGQDPTNGGNYFPSNVRVDMSGGVFYTTKVPFGLYTMAEALDTLAAKLSAATGATFSVTKVGNAVTLSSTVAFRFPISGSGSNKNLLVGRLGFKYGGAYVSSQTIFNNQPYADLSGNVFASFPNPSLQEYQYLDFVSDQLTYNQELKDASTSTDTTRDIVYRWYLANEFGTYTDTYGFPTYPGYSPFYERRPIAFPKQIKWSGDQPIGQLQFQVYATDYAGNTELLNTDGYDWGMTILVSEV